MLCMAAMPHIAAPFRAFLDVLRREQRREGLSDTRMARKCGVSGAYWSLVLNEWRSPGAKFLLGAFQAFPHHHVDASEDVEPPVCVACDLATALAGTPADEFPAPDTDDEQQTTPLLLPPRTAAAGVPRSRQRQPA